MPFSDVVKLEVPALFPLAEFELFWNSAREVLPRPSDERREFNGASSLIAFRFRSCLEYEEGLLRSWKAVGVNAPHEEQYVRERALFGMFSSGVSTVESACYANFALAAVCLGLPFDEEARTKAKPFRLLKALKDAAPTARLTVALRGALESAEWELWTDYRNTMAHRSPVPRVIYGSTGILPPANILEYGETWSTSALSGNEQALVEHVSWIADSVREILDGGVALARAHIPSTTSQVP